MKLVRYGEPGRERPGVLLDDPNSALAILDVRAMAYDIADYDGFFFARHGVERVAGLLREHKRKLIPAAGVRLGPPVARPGKIICVGKNYADHAQEFDAQLPASPILFGKASTSLNGPCDPIIVEPGTATTDAEVELAVVIGTRTTRVSAGEAPACIAGCMVLNDVTDRHAQKEGHQWFRGKSPDSFCPVGPWLVTPDEFNPLADVALCSRLNQETLQQGETGRMIFDIPHLIAFISRTITLEPGDIIATGTPGGVGFARNPPVYLKPGDEICCTIEGLGTTRNRVVERT